MSAARWLSAAFSMMLLSATAWSCDGDPEAPPAWAQCQASDQAFVRRSIIGLTGRMPWGQPEVAVLADMLAQLRDSGLSEPEARAVVAKTIMADETFEDRWFDAILDMLRVPRPPFIRDNQWNLAQTERCYEEPVIAVNEELAAYVRDHSPLEREPPLAQFTLGNLLRSSLKLDNLTPIYRAHLMFLVTLALPGANVDPLELERERRRDFGVMFESAYLNRNPGCLQCHNSQGSVAETTDSGEVRFWPVPGRFEEAIYGSSEAPDDPLVYRSVLRNVDVVDSDTGDPAWGWQPNRCGKFKLVATPDPLGIEAYFGTIHKTAENPALGKMASVWQLESSLRAGFEKLRADGLQMDGDGHIADADAAFAYLVSMSIAEQVWIEIMGRPLTLAHHFPRTEAQRDLLIKLTDRFISSGYSLKALLVEIVTQPVFNLAAPEVGCGGLYGLPLYFEPFALERPEGERGNTFGDVLHALATRTPRSALHIALGWPRPLRFPPAEGGEQEFQIATGFFNTSTAPGFRGLDFQGRLNWESRYGACALEGTPSDFITALLEEGVRQGATLEDVVTALRDRLAGEPELTDAAERQAVEALLGRSLSEPVANEPSIESALRLVCGALAVSPQFMLGGMVAADTSKPPKLILPGNGYSDQCQRIAQHIVRVAPNYSLDCSAQPASLNVN